MNRKKNKKNSLGLYVHVPFCSFLCHYCDFSKTAVWDQEVINQYVERISSHLKLWVESYKNKSLNIDTLHLGGGTPSLLIKEWVYFFHVLKALKIHPSEISLEANPENISDSALDTWSSLGINRLSVGVQSFDEAGLKFLTRQIKPQSLYKALDMVCQSFSNNSIDLIYGWPNQSESSLLNDLSIINSFPIKHLSLYNLCYERKTPIGRAFHRGRIKSMADAKQEQLYHLACDFLKDNGFNHYECSNWAKPGFESKHNSRYWRGEEFIGIGSGAWGYVANLPGTETETPFGCRFNYDPSYKKLLKTQNPFCPSILSIDQLSKDLWIIDLVGSHLRHKGGIDLQQTAKLGYNFKPTHNIELALKNGCLNLDGYILTLTEKEWLRENAWCQEVLNSFEN